MAGADQRMKMDKVTCAVHQRFIDGYTKSDKMSFEFFLRLRWL